MPKKYINIQIDFLKIAPGYFLPKHNIIYNLYTCKQSLVIYIDHFLHLLKVLIFTKSKSQSPKIKKKSNDGEKVQFMWYQFFHKQIPVNPSTVVLHVNCKNI